MASDKHVYRTSNTALKRLEKRLRELAFLNSGVRIILTDRNALPEPLRYSELFYEGGVKEFVKIPRPLEIPLSCQKPIFQFPPVKRMISGSGACGEYSYHENCLPFTNKTIPQRRWRRPYGGLSGRIDADDQ